MRRHRLPNTRGTDRIVVLSGSCSPVTAGQIEYAERNGFASIRLDVIALTTVSAPLQQRKKLAPLRSTHCRKGRSVVLFTAVVATGSDRDVSAHGGERRFPQTLSERAGQILNSVARCRRYPASGGSGRRHVQSCRTATRNRCFDFSVSMRRERRYAERGRVYPHRQNLEIVFKGGQCGAEDFLKSF